ncbi:MULTISPECIES: Na/Pi cotransporter family protein [Rhizobium/Agrobacterium group]|uniref:Sodium-dependent inorganic phosphate transporter n=1 Tax=Agrobacterium deltaense Zutra 3/1 TaxID=1183427 RepID=A0A1S7RG60_9HYPH|nr:MULTISPECIES: Na/Pi cotransporter family protein [Rhizobium/Agrobacterium group]MBB4403718.1 phosphate:Na+ symporter [Agrobacterium radiobacter]MBB5589871.1 phosphate:Na+ symporter [Agrobacterium radiobacter]RVT76209.1 Na/Pi cotransporter family protein [Agrobacterium sp. CNPSo 2736]TGE87384.1 Na/Pi cotransporter family protein [Rhizobium sp. SEMIA 4032]CUX51562.1 Sodium-dependent inorganic phosphate transporter [Agrobacterium deltaense Zutra 3/1]
MESVVVSINLFGAVALLLFGLGQIKDGMSRAFGARLRIGLAAGTRGGFRSFIAGLVATIALQSSTATALMVASFVEKDLIAPAMAQIVLLGANVGTAMTAWIVALGLGWLSPMLILAGVVLSRGKSVQRQGAGAALAGVGLMLLSLHLLSAATYPIRQSPALGLFIGMLGNAWPVALIFSAVLAALASSSLAIVVLILSLAASGGVETSLVIVLVLGANLGGAVPPVLATLRAPVAARRVAVGNLIVRAIGCLAALPLAGYGAALLEMSPFSHANLAVDAHLFFNLAVAAIAWPLSPLLLRVTTALLPEKEKSESHRSYLDSHDLDQPVAALAGASREVLLVGDLIERMLRQAGEAMRDSDVAKLNDISALEGRVDRIQHDIKVYVSKVGQDGLSGKDQRRAMDIVEYAINLEHIGDIIEKGIRPEIAKKIDLGLRFSDDGKSELERLFTVTLDNIRMAQSVFATRNAALARRLVEVKEDVRRLEKQSSERHLQRLRDGRADSIQTSSVHLDMLRDLKRINAHIAAVAHPILDESGLLIESRIKQVG